MNYSYLKLTTRAEFDSAAKDLADAIEYKMLASEADSLTK